MSGKPTGPESVLAEVDKLISVTPRERLVVRQLRRSLSMLRELGQRVKPDERAQERVRSLIDRLQVAILALDTDGHYVAVSRGASTLTGYARAELIGKSIFDTGLALNPCVSEGWQQFLDRKESAAKTILPDRGGNVVSIQTEFATICLLGLHAAALAGQRPRYASRLITSETGEPQLAAELHMHRRAVDVSALRRDTAVVRGQTMRDVWSRLRTRVDQLAAHLVCEGPHVLTTVSFVQRGDPVPDWPRSPCDVSVRMRSVGSTVIVAVVVLVGGCSSTSENQPQEQAAVPGTEYRDAEYVIEGQRIKLADGRAEAETSPGSASRIVTRYFGNELKTDLNDDGREDVVFLLTQQRGGSGMFFYAVAALNTEAGYLGSDGYLLGDRIAPQTTVVSRNPRHKNVIVVNYGDRRPDEPMTAQPSVGKSVYLKLDAETVRWGIVVPDFEGESR